ncbi:MAG TPA: helix-turn-helix domain-containing protein [Candidatus Paceibacterota bacterium]
MSSEINSNIVKQLREIGLKQNESEVYLFLLQNGISTPPVIARGTNIARTNCYNILGSLKEKGVVDEQLKGKRKAYIARTPESLKLSLQRKLEVTDRLLPDLEALHITQKNKPVFRFYDGWQEVKQIYEFSLQAKKIYGLGSTERLDSIDENFFENYISKCKKNNIEFQDLVTHDSEKSSNLIKNVRGEMHKIKFLPEEYSQNITDLLIWDDSIALISLEEPIFGTVITSKPLASTLKMILQLIWNKI